MMQPIVPNWAKTIHAFIAEGTQLNEVIVTIGIGDKTITYLIFIPDDLFLVIPCVLCVRMRTSRGTNTELLDKNYLTEICSELIR